MRFIPQLDSDSIFQHVMQTHSLWGGDQTLETRVLALKNRLAVAGSESLTLSGLMDDKGALAGSLKRYYLDLELNRKTVRCIGLGAVFTHPDFRKKGVARELIDRVLQDARDLHGCGAALLFSDIGTPYYETFGFKATPALSWQAPLESLPSSSPLTYRNAITENQPELLRWFADLTGRFPVRCARTPQSWTLFREINHVDQDLILSSGERDVGYMSVSFNTKRNHLWVEEWLAAPEYERAVWATIRDLAVSRRLGAARGWQLPHYTQSAEIAPREKAIPMILDLSGKLALTLEDLTHSWFSSSDHF